MDFSTITRLDILIIAFWQVILLYNAQLLMPIFLNYMPSQKCDGLSYHHAFCYDVHERCNRCVQGCEVNICRGNDTCFHAIRNAHFFHSAAEDYGQFCNPHLRLIRVDTIQYLGLLIGTIASVLLAEKYGRRRVLLSALCIGLPALLISGEVTHVVWFYLFRFVVGLCNGGGLVVGWCYVSELITSKKRVLLRLFSSWPLARLILTFVCYVFGDWRMATRSLVVLCLPLIPALYFLLPESHVWMALRGHRLGYADSIVRMNALAGSVYVKKSDHHMACKLTRVSLKVGVANIFAHPILRKRMMVLFSFWFVSFYASFILDLNSDSMLTSAFFLPQFVLCSLLVITKIILGLFLIYFPSTSRKTMHLWAQAGFVLFVVLIMILYLTGHKGSTGFMFVWFAATICIELCCDICSILVNELMPIEVRSSAFAACSIVSRIGIVASTFATASKDIYEPGMYINVIVFSIVNWLVSYFCLDETDLKKTARLAEALPRKPTKVWPTITVTDFDNLDTNGDGQGTENTTADKNAEKTNNGQPKEEHSTKKKEDDLGFSDLIFWTTPAINPCYDPTSLQNETQIDEEKKDESTVSSLCNLFDGTCQNIGEVILKAELVEQSLEKEVEDEAQDSNEVSKDEDEEEESTVIRF